MSNVTAFSLNGLQAEPQPDIQLKLLNNALARFCDEIESDVVRRDEERRVATREVVWRLGQWRFRAKLVTFDDEASIGTYDYSESRLTGWQRLTTPRALAEKLTQAM